MIEIIKINNSIKCNSNNFNSKNSKETKYIFNIIILIILTIIIVDCNRDNKRNNI